MDPAALKLINPDAPPLDAAARAEIAALARRQARSRGLVMRAATAVGGQVEEGLRALPPALRRRIEGAARLALEQSYDLAGRSRGGIGARLAGARAHRALATVSGALGGVGGLATALIELPLATTLIFRAVQDVAASHGEDPQGAETRLECLRVFGAGGPGTGDDGVDSTFLGARLALTGPALSKLLAKVAPRFAVVVGQKLAAQSAPVLGAAAGAGINNAFTGYYTEIAHVHFGLRRLARRHDAAQVQELFHAELARARRLTP